uniref:Methyltransferase FkbM domain-containing protein n=1 Tax=Leptocylindrus danicus TaxID=163516 RepID=A0A7S2PPD5_9STRA|mmetsp:Transcript_670/g.918  ORF Transcript_670/g.918 Transcript_670/m.918 type:complete len:424 (+) Transcript_670:116-1387(+)
MQIRRLQKGEKSACGSAPVTNLSLLLAVGIGIFGLLQFGHQVYKLNTIQEVNTAVDKQQHESTQLLHLQQADATQKLPRCTEDQLRTIGNHLPADKCHMHPWMQRCSFTQATNCPEQTWIEQFYANESMKKGAASASNISFVGISIGCNKGFDAIATMRMGSWNKRFDKVSWGEALQADGVDIDAAVCKQDGNDQAQLQDDVKVRSGSEMHCVEPMPMTHAVLQQAANSLGLVDDGFRVANYAISKTSGTALFPTANLGNKSGEDYQRVKVGTENKGLDSCAKLSVERQKEACQEVAILSLDEYVSKHVASQGPIHMLSIDVEGYDFDVMLGGREALKRTHYVEFEYNWMGSWRHQHLEETIQMLDEDGFTCYWAGKDKLWRITDCWKDYYDKHNWSNVACVSRSQVELASRMENLFLQTLKG